MPAQRHVSPRVKHKSTLDFDKQAEPEHSAPAGLHNSQAERTWFRQTEVIFSTNSEIRQCEIMISGVLIATFSLAGPDGNSRHKRGPNTEQAHSMTLQRFDAETLTSISQHLKSNTKRNQARGREKQWKQQSASYADLIHKSLWLLSPVVQSGEQKQN